MFNWEKKAPICEMTDHILKLKSCVVAKYMFFRNNSERLVNILWLTNVLLSTLHHCQTFCWSVFKVIFSQQCLLLNHIL